MVVPRRYYPTHEWTTAVWVYWRQHQISTNRGEVFALDQGFPIRPKLLLTVVQIHPLESLPSGTDNQKRSDDDTAQRLVPSDRQSPSIWSA